MHRNRHSRGWILLPARPNIRFRLPSWQRRSRGSCLDPVGRYEGGIGRTAESSPSAASSSPSASRGRHPPAGAQTLTATHSPSSSKTQPVGKGASSTWPKFVSPVLPTFDVSQCCLCIRDCYTSLALADRPISMHVTYCFLRCTSIWRCRQQQNPSHPSSGLGYVSCLPWSFAFFSPLGPCWSLMPSSDVMPKDTILNNFLNWLL
jgi:hypothetical protein